MLFQYKLGGGLYPGGLYTDVFVCLQKDPSSPPPQAYKNASVCVCVWGGGGGGGGAYKRKFMVFETVKHCQFKEQRTDT